MTDLTMSQFASKDDLIAAQAARIAELEAELEAVGAGGVQRLAAAPQACSRSHPHEEMTPMCELRTEIARMTNALARAEAQRAAAPQAVQWLAALDALQEAEAALELAIHRILKRDPGHAVHVTSEAKALVAVRAALDAAQAKQGGASHG